MVNEISNESNIGLMLFPPDTKSAWDVTYFKKNILLSLRCEAIPKDLYPIFIEGTNDIDENNNYSIWGVKIDGIFLKIWELDRKKFFFQGKPFSVKGAIVPVIVPDNRAGENTKDILTIQKRYLESIVLANLKFFLPVFVLLVLVYPQQDIGLPLEDIIDKQWLTDEVTIARYYKDNDEEFKKEFLQFVTKIKKNDVSS